ncbi:hypothetical protein [Paraglaciecola sp. L1A13]|uniref:hypothetical protein n=1 Tax=Paraglaciecola sp. L1A13 TaxID=2686359 RepID=UPI00351A1BED
MNTSDYNVFEQLPTVEEFCSLRKQAGWGDTDAYLAELSLANTLYCVCIRQSSQLLAMGRVIGDGAMYFLSSRHYRGYALSRPRFGERHND